jgi:hypothetical protein
VKGLKNANVATVTVGNAECQANFDYTASDDNQVVIGPVSCVSSS